MSEIVRIATSNTLTRLVRGVNTQSLVSNLADLGPDEKETLVAEAEAVLSRCIPPGTDGSTTGIVIGYVQSGKTLSFTTLTALAVDNGFRVIIYLAGIKLNLLEQTTKRLKRDLISNSGNARRFKIFEGPKVADNYTGVIKNILCQEDKPVILITVLKHYKQINELTRIFGAPELKEVLGNAGVIVIDDEADQASLNTYARKNSTSEDWQDDEYSSTYSSILALRAVFKNHSYLQYTATPQGPLLINLMDLLSPKFHVVLTPGKGYTGGKTFFEDNGDLIVTIPDKQVYHHKNNNLPESPDSLICALQGFLVSVAIIVKIQKKEPFLSMLVHADREKDASKKFGKWVRSLIDNWAERLTRPNDDPSKVELLEQFHFAYEDLSRRIPAVPSFADVARELSQVVLDINMQVVIQGAKDIDWDQFRAHVLIGADMLNRGYTVERLAISYMPRNSVGKSNADTIQQRCRFFGYKQNYLEACRIFLPNSSILEYREYVEHEEIMRKQLKEKTLEQFEQMLILNSAMNPTRSNILSKNLVKHKLNGWRQMNVLQHIEENIECVEKFFSKHKMSEFKDFGTPDRNHRYVKIDVETAMNFLKDFKISNMPDALRKSSTLQYLRHLWDLKRIDHVYVFEMAYGVEKGRERTLLHEKGLLKISNIFSGRSTSGVQTYPGDRDIKFDEALCIQIHRIRLTDSSMQWDKRMLYTLGMYYPEELSHAFVGIPRV